MITLGSLLGGCVSVQSKSSLPSDWQAAMLAKSAPDISGEYRFRGEGELIPDNRITAFLPGKKFSLAKSFTLRQIDATHLEVHMAEDGAKPFQVEVQSNPETGEVTVPSFSESESGSSAFTKVVFKKGSDGALYVRQTSVGAGLAEKLPIPMAGVLRLWCRFLPIPPRS